MYKTIMKSVLAVVATLAACQGTAVAGGIPIAGGLPMPGMPALPTGAVQPPTMLTQAVGGILPAGG